MTEPLRSESIDPRVPFAKLSVIRQASLYAWYVNLRGAERRRVDALDDEAFEAEYLAARRCGDA